MNSEDIYVGDFIQFTFGETHGILAGRTESGEVLEKIGDILTVQSGGSKCVVFTEEVNRKIKPIKQ